MKRFSFLFLCAMSVLLALNSCEDLRPSRVDAMFFDSIVSTPPPPSVGSGAVVMSPIDGVIFGNIGVGVTANSSITIKNNKSESITISSIKLPTWLKVNTSVAGQKIASGASLDVIVSCTPSAAQTYSGYIELWLSGATIYETRIYTSVTGVGAQPNKTRLTTATGALSFGAAPIGTSVVRNITFTNTGSVAAQGTFTMPTGYSISGGSSFFISAGQTLSYTVYFNPSLAQSYVGTMRVDYNANDGNALTISLSGTGTAIANAGILLAADQAFSIASIDFGTGQSFQTTKMRAIYMKNTGNAPLVITGIQSDNTGVFKNPTPTGGYPLTIQPGAWYGLSVTAVRPSILGTYTCTYTVYSNATNGKNTITASIIFI